MSCYFRNKKLRRYNSSDKFNIKAKTRNSLHQLQMVRTFSENK